MDDMISGKRRSAAVNFVFLLGLSVCILAGKNDENGGEIARQSRQLGDVEKEIGRFKHELYLMRKEEKNILNDLRETEFQIELNRAEITRIHLNLQLCDSEISALKKRIDFLSEEIEKDKLVLGNHLRRMYKTGRLGYLKTLLGAENITSLMSGYRYALYFANQDVKLISDTETDVRELSERQRRLQKMQERAAGLKAEHMEKEKTLKAMVNRKKGLLSGIRTDETYHSLLIQDLEKTAEALEGMISDFRNKNIADGENKIIYPLFSLCRKNLPWPVEGKILSRFGKKRDPRFGTYTVRNGIEIHCSTGTPIRAVHDGFVVFADWFKNYGRLIILDHQLGYYSLYAYASRIDATLGNFVEKGNIIGATGYDGLNGTTCLHFEIRRKTKPIDPLAWLEISKN